MSLLSSTAAGTAPRNPGRRSSSGWAGIAAAARVGYGAKGAIYLIVGGLAAAAAAGVGGETTGSRGALTHVLAQPLGHVMLGLLALGLGAYAVWRWVQAALDPEHASSDLRSAGKRIYALASALLHTGLVVVAVKMLIGLSSGSSRDWTASALTHPAARWAVGLGGAAVALFSLARIFRALRSDFHRHIDRDTLGWLASPLEFLGRFGVASRALLLALVGGFFVQAAIHASSAETGGIAQALKLLERQPYAPGLYTAVAVGLLAYGIHQWVKAAARRIEVES